ncbi:MAG: LysE family translocator [Desulfuromonadales bacterium]|nr:LysE family translocator [Desulfuromonadales bacterium]
MDYDLLLMYSVVSFFYIISPGPAIFLAISNGMTTNMKIVALSSLGNIFGLFLLSVIAISGLGALLAASSTLFMITKLFGASYLIYLGIRQFRNGKEQLLPGAENTNQANQRYLSSFKEGFFLASTNPKPILFFTALFPQFIDIETSIIPQFFIMTAIFMLFSFVSLFSYGFISKTAKHFLTNQNNITWFHRVTGGLLISMGVGLLKLKSTQS